VLFVLGYLHGLIYGGDILQILAVTGVLLVPLYRRSNTTLVIVALFFILQVPALVLYAMANVIPAIDYARPLHWSLHPKVFEIYANGTFPEVFQTNLWQGQVAKWTFMFESGRIWNILGLSVLGFLLARNGFFTDVARYRQVYVRAFIGALIVATIFLTFRERWIALAASTESRWIYSNILESYANHALIAVTLLALILLYQLRRGAALLGLLAPCGRMSLTIYVSQSLILVPFFYGYGAGAHAFIGQPMSLLLGVVLWCLQVAFAHYWFRHYYYGPLEWLWRSATWLRSDVPFERSATA
jgi:uncharacterized protein